MVNETSHNNALDVQTPFRSSVASAGTLLVIRRDQNGMKIKRFKDY
jgi:hypothetical protein